MISRTVKVKIFWYFEILNFRSDDEHFRETSETAILAEELKRNRTTLVAIARTAEIVIKKRQRITELTDNVPSCNYCVATETFGTETFITLYELLASCHVLN